MRALAVDIDEQGIELLFKTNIVMWAAQSSLLAEFIKRDSTYRTRSLIKTGQFLSGLSQL